MRHIFSISLMLLFALCVGCGGTKELEPDSSQVKQVSPEEIQKKIQEGMQKAGDIKQSTLQKK